MSFFKNFIPGGRGSQEPDDEEQEGVIEQISNATTLSFKHVRVFHLSPPSLLSFNSSFQISFDPFNSTLRGSSDFAFCLQLASFFL